VAVGSNLGKGIQVFLSAILSGFLPSFQEYEDSSSRSGQGQMLTASRHKGHFARRSVESGRRRPWQSLQLRSGQSDLVAEAGSSSWSACRDPSQAVVQVRGQQAYTATALLLLLLLTNCGAEHYSRGHSIVSQRFMEHESSLPHSQELSTCPYPEPDQSSPHHPIPPLQDAS
jgi:hypothetical protein